jgi:hypothetical protein
MAGIPGSGFVVQPFPALKKSRWRVAVVQVEAPGFSWGETDIATAGFSPGITGVRLGPRFL